MSSRSLAAGWTRLAGTDCDLWRTITTLWIFFGEGVPVVGLNSRWLCALAFLAALALPSGGAPAAEPPSAELLLHLKAGNFDPLAGPAPLPDSLRMAAEPAAGYFVVQLRRPARTTDMQHLHALGAKVVNYLPSKAYVVRLPAGKAAAVRALDEVRWLGTFQPGFKIAPDLGLRPLEDPSRRTAGGFEVTVDLFPEEDLEAVAAQVTGIGAELVRSYAFSDTRRLELRATRAQIEQIAWISAVAWIEEVGEIKLRNNTARWVVQTDVVDSTTVWDHGLHGEGQVIGHIDSKIDVNSCFFRDPVNNTPGPGHRKIIAYRSSSGLGVSSHGTHTAGTAAGDQFPLNGTISSNGHAYAAKISYSNLSDITGSGAATSNLYQYLSSAHADGARVHSNSWGDDGTTAYTTWCRDIDLFAYDFEDSLVLFAVTNLSSLRTPENAKNVLAVGASQNGLNDDSFCSGGTGPTIDGRRKPEIYAPGCSILSARSSFTCSTVSQTGTSMACPAVTGAGALVRQYFQQGWYPSGGAQPGDALNPSGALVKAVLLNSAVDMTNISGFPSNQEGWGRVLLENTLSFAGDVRGLAVLADVRNAGGLTSGQNANYPLVVLDDQENLKVTLTFAEPAAALFASTATVNNLDLVVTSPSGLAYRGNSFSGGQSLAGGGADPINNAEVVLVGSPEPGEWSVRVEGTSVNQGLQGFSLVASGQVAIPGGQQLRYDSYTVQDQSPLGNNDGRVDPGETVTLPVTLRNLQSTMATSVSANLFSSLDKVRVTEENAAYPNVPANGTATSLAPHYRLTVAPDTACGTVIPFDVDILHALGAAASAFSIQVGRNELQYPATGVPLAIPTAGQVMSTIQIADVTTIQDINVAVNVLHQNIGELSLLLFSPQGTQLTLHNRTGVGQANLNAIYDANRQPDGPGSMNDFNGEPIAGTWTLKIKDAVGGATPAGTLQSWSLLIEPAGGATCAPLSCGVDPVPAEVPHTLLLGRQGANLQFFWQAVAGASGYRIWRSSAPEFSRQEMIGSGSGTNLVVPPGDGEIDYFLVRAFNSCQWEGP